MLVNLKKGVVIHMETDNLNLFIENNWENIKENVRNEYDIADISFDTWIRPLKFKSIENDIVSIIIPEDRAQAINYITKKYKTYFVVTITEMTDHNIDVNFILEDDAKNEDIIIKEKIYNINSENANLISKYRFDTFVVANNLPEKHTILFIFTEDQVLVKPTLCIQ